MRLPFFEPRRHEVAATATDLITRFVLRAGDEASHLAQLSAQMHSRWHRVLYELVAREIDASFVEAQKRLGLRQSASGTARLPYPQAKDTKRAAGALGISSSRAAWESVRLGPARPGERPWAWTAKWV
jgi:hypothetical protein